MRIKKLGAEDVETLRRAIEQPKGARVSVRELAKEAGVSVQHLYRTLGPFKGKGNRYTSRVCREKVRAVQVLVAAGWKHSDVGRAVELSEATVTRIIENGGA